jgi:DNA invertase Pin-like site-specific DNA recombinase
MPDFKITADHIRRDAYLYVRQSTLRQVAENGESTQRQYALRDRAIASGWPAERVRIIDCDLGKSGSSAIARDGFQQLVSEVALTKAGIVMGLEVSRLARNSADWHRLIELCALTATLILDEDGIYDPASFNDRLLLGLKGTMSEAELHILRARMRGGQLNKARRGELEIGPPVGLIYRSDGRLDLDPDAEVQAAIRLVFDTFERTAAPPGQSGSSWTKAYCFQGDYAKSPTRASCYGRRPAIPASFRCCIIRDTLAPSSMDERAGAIGRTAASLRSRCPWRIGNSSCQTSTRGTSTGNASRPTKRDFPTMGEPTGFSADQDRCERDPACSKAASCAASVVSEWAFATARKTVKRS